MRGTLSLPSLSPIPTPPMSPNINIQRAPPTSRSVSWSLPDESLYHGSVQLPEIRIHQHQVQELEDPEHLDVNTPQFLAWRRLHLSKAKLTGISEMAAVMAGFSVVATVELQINNDANPYLLSAFTVTTSLLVCTTMLAVMISTCILPHIEVVAKMSPHSKAHESPHDKMMFLIDLSWVLANTFSIFLFTLDVIILCWIKFTYFSEAASWCATAIMIPVLIGVFVFGIIFYRRLVQHQYIISDKKYQESLGKDELSTPEFLAWRRLHLSKSKLANCVEVAEIFAGFSVVVTVELQINDKDVNPSLMIAFVVTTSLLVSVSLLAVMISTCILPHIVAVSKMAMVSQVNQSPHDSMIRLIDLCWVLTNTVSLFLFTLDVILMCWIKFAYFSKTAAWAATVIMVPVLIAILLFGIIFYRTIVNHQYDVSSKKYQELERMRENLDAVDHGEGIMTQNSISALRFGGSLSSLSSSTKRSSTRSSRNEIHNV